MSKLRFAVIFPILMLFIAFSVARWQRYVDSQSPPKHEYPTLSKVTSLYRGVNAPAMLFEGLCMTFLPIDRLNHPPSSFLGIPARQLLFFSGVVVLWSIVGQTFDRRKDKTHLHTETSLWKFVRSLSVLAFAIVLFFGGVSSIRGRESINPIGDMLQGILCIGWSLSLAAASGPRFLTGFNRMRLRLRQSKGSDLPPASFT